VFPNVLNPVTASNSILTIDSHTAGESTRLVVQGLPPLQGSSMAEKMADAQTRLAWAPGALLQEPRGHKDLYGAILTAPCHSQADFGVIFMSNHSYEPMCGHGLIGVVTSLLETGFLPAQEPETELTADTPAGLIAVHCQVSNGRVIGVAFDNVPSFALALDLPIRLENGLRLLVDVAYGGNFFLLVDSAQIQLELTVKNARQLAELGMQALQAANEQIPVAHPQLAFLDSITDLRFYGDPLSPGADSRNIVILGDHMVDRSPCGTGTCAELASRYARHRIGVGESLITESILGTQFKGTVLGEVGNELTGFPFPAIIPRLEGKAYLTGIHRFVLQDDDPFKNGFLITT